MRYGEGLFIGYRGYDSPRTDVAFPFGFGLSYTTFALSDLSVAISGSVADGNLAADVTVTVTNTGPVAGAEVVQVYVRDVESSVARPVRELKGFAKVSLEPGQSRAGHGHARPARLLVLVRAAAHRGWSRPGSSPSRSATTPATCRSASTVAVDAPSIAAPLTADSTLHEWMADPAGLELIAKPSPQASPTRPATRSSVAVIGTMPMSTLAAFKGMSIDHDTLDKLAERVHAR